MITVEQARHKAQNLYDRKFAEWAVVGCEAPPMDAPLHPPTQETVLADATAAADWVAHWRAEEQKLSRGATITWESRQWASAGTQRVPARLALHEPADAAAFAGRQKHWAAAAHRAEELVDLLRRHSAEATTPVEDVPDAVRRRLKKITELTVVEYTRLRDALDWLLTHPSPGIYPRQMPIRGVDSKWLEKHSSIVEPLYSAATGSASLGLLRGPGLIRLRFLDHGSAPAGLRDLSAPVEELNRLEVAPRAVIMVENLQTLLALPQMSGVIAVHSAGYAAKSPAAISWLRECPVIYWGDLDVDGFRILSIVRAALPQTSSVLMDRGTLKEHLDLAGPDRKDAPRTLPDHLTGPERDGFAALQEFGEVRLEQERIPWDFALAAIERALDEHQ
ncbi:MAG: Wadjet anti-phage system protein JetD domain-containing protein [Nesterenkonia sp.]